MSDTEQGLMVTALAVPPLRQAAQRAQEADATAWEACLASQSLKGRARALAQRIATLQREEAMTPSRARVAQVRAERRQVEHALTRVQAERTAADAVRAEATAAAQQARLAAAALCEVASKAYRRMQLHDADARNRALPAVRQLDGEEKGELAYADLCGLVGVEEADRVRASSERPAWCKA